MLSNDTGQDVARIEKDTDRDFVMTADEAVVYGLVDEVIASREGTTLAAVGAA
jgi:ATP-dependent Clp protease protease subunit